MHKHRLKFRRGASHFMFWQCSECNKEYISTRRRFMLRFLGINLPDKKGYE